MSTAEVIVGAVLAVACMATAGGQAYRLHRAVHELRRHDR